VPNVRNFTEGRAMSTFDARGLKVKVQIVPGVVSTSGRVVAQSPAYATVVKKGSVVTVDVGGTPPRVTVPSVVGLSEAMAKSQLTAIGFNVRVKTVKQTDISQKEGDVLGESPDARAGALKGSIVTIRVVSGTALVAVPEWSNDSPQEAGAVLIKADLEPGTSSKEYGTPVAPGDVISSNPPSGKLVRQGTTVALVISGGPGIQIPNDLIGQALPAAETELQTLGLSVAKGRVDIATPAVGLWGNVAGFNCNAPANQKQFPHCAAGSAVGPGATITLRLGKPSPGSDTTTTSSSTTTTTTTTTVPPPASTTSTPVTP
jgi:beta-lactam-binding protein with PASTA domain